MNVMVAIRRFFNCGAEEPGGEVVASGDAVQAAVDTEDEGNEGDEGGEGDASQPRSKRRKSQPADYSQLCSHSVIDLHRYQGSGGGADHSASSGVGGGGRGGSGVVGSPRPGCYDCLVGSSNTHGLPGGAVCCGTRGDLSQCPRAWE